MGRSQPHAYCSRCRLVLPGRLRHKCDSPCSMLSCVDTTWSLGFLLFASAPSLLRPCERCGALSLDKRDGKCIKALMSLPCLCSSFRTPGWGLQKYGLVWCRQTNERLLTCSGSASAVCGIQESRVAFPFLLLELCGHFNVQRSSGLRVDVLACTSLLLWCCWGSACSQSLGGSQEAPLERLKPTAAI